MDIRIGNECETKIITEIISYKWTINNYKKIYKNIHSLNTSFTVDNNKWFIFISPVIYSGITITVRLCNTSTLCKDSLTTHAAIGSAELGEHSGVKWVNNQIEVSKVKLTIFNENIEIAKKVILVTIYDINKCYTFTNIVDIRNIKNDLIMLCEIETYSKINTYNDTLSTTACNGTACNGTACNATACNATACNGICGIQNDMLNILNNSIHSDFVIICNDVEFKTHKAILSVRSKFFEKFFINNSQNSIKFNDMDIDVMKKILEYIYSNKVTNIKDNVKSLLEMSDKYGFLPLKEMCEITINKNINLDNVIELLILSDISNANILQTSLIKFVVSNYSKVYNTVEWRKLITKNPYILEKILNIVCLRS